MLFNMRFYVHLSAIISVFLWRLLDSLLFGKAYFGPGLFISIFIMLPICEWYYTKKLQKGIKEMIREYRLRDWN
jgi:hypothetical protein